MLDNWLVQGIIQNTVWALLVLAAGFLVAFVSAKSQKYANSVLYGLAGAVLMLFLIVQGRALFSSSSQSQLPTRAEEKVTDDLQQEAEAKKNTPEYVQNQLRGWLEQMGYSIRAVEAKGDLIFRLAITGDIVFDISNMKPQPDILILEARVLAKPHVLKAMSRLPKQKLLKFLNEVNLELLRSGVETGMITKSDGSETSTYLRHQIPIEPDKRAIFLREILRFKAAIIIIELYYDKISDGYFN